MTHLSSETFDSNAREALKDETLRGALRLATSLFGERRRHAMEEVPNWEDLRERARQIKEATLARLDHHLLQFEGNLLRDGVLVHWARDADEACRVISSIATDQGVKTIVKSKSMTSEEIHLNESLEEGGSLPVETDLGEWIIQLAGEAPSHIIVPAIHKTRGQIGGLFAKELDIDYTDDPDELTRTARGVLRRYFAEADMGISGVNFAVAETGTILILENEGNIRLTTTLPRVHVALMGIEKVIPTMADLGVFLRLLPRSGTGQHLTSYQTLLTGVRRDGEEGPPERHVVILDNGRTGMLAQRVTRQALACIRCGACLNACPVYQQIGGHAYGSVYPGPIGAVITPQLSGLEKAAKLPFASSLCGACREVCPVKIDIPELLLHLRSEVCGGKGPSGSGRGLGERIGFRLWSWFMSGPRRYRFATRLARLGTSRGLSGRIARSLAPLVDRWTDAREIRPAARRSFRELWRDDQGGKDR